MIILYHNTKKVTAIYGIEFNFQANNSIAEVLFLVSKSYPDTIILWCNEKYKSYLNKEAIATIFHHNLIVASYSVSGNYVISDKIGYVEKTPFSNVQKNVTYPTWLMSSDVGGGNTSVFNTLDKKMKPVNDFNYFICSLAKQAMSKGLFCYSEPKLIKASFFSGNNIEKLNASIFTLFRFVRQHYKFIWIVNLMLCFVFFEKRLPFLPFFKSIFYSKFKNNIDFSNILIQSTKKVIDEKKYDVIIPTIGRKAYLYDVLKDINKQTLLPENVIIVEQNPDKNSQSELDYIKSETWSFKIKHIFIHQTGACNARNLALSYVENEWVLLGDDDNRFESDLVESLFLKIEKLGVKVVTTTYIQPHEKQNYHYLTQTDIFGTGNSMLKSEFLNDISFDMGYEFGYSEDADYGMQIRKIGQDIIYTPDIKIKHLKAPMGGFRIKQPFLWDNEDVEPQPSPTVMLFYHKHYNKYQVLGSKYDYIVKSYNKQSIKNPFRYLDAMNKKWKASEYWSAVLAKKSN